MMSVPWDHMGHGLVNDLECSFFFPALQRLEVNRWKADGRGRGCGTPPGVRIIRSQQQQQQQDKSMTTATEESGNSRMELTILSSIC